MNKKTVRDMDLHGKRVLMRVDFNVPIENGKVKDDKRIKAALPTINHVLNHGAALILMSHLGRPKSGPDPDFSLLSTVEVLAGYIGRPVLMAPDCVGPEVLKIVNGIKPGEVVMLENTRFHPEEEVNEMEFARQLASLGDIYVNDAFGSAHRAHASTEGVAHYLPAVSGFLMEKELEFLNRATFNPEHPFIAILGGAKISDKILVVENLLSKCDKMIIGGGMANTILAADGINVQDSLVEPDSINTAKPILAKFKEKIILPVDAVVADRFSSDADSQIVEISKIPTGWRIMDVGPKTIGLYKEVLQGAKLIVWNGPVGVFEMPKFSEGTFALARILAESGATTVIGGGDSASAVKQAGVAKQMTFISTGGGASLEFLEGKVLPGVAALLDK